MQGELTPRLKQSVIAALTRRLAFRIVDVETAAQAGKLGPRLLRMRARLLEQERQRIANLAQEYGVELG